MSVANLQSRGLSGRAGAIELAVALWIAFAPETARASTHVSVAVLASTEEHATWTDVGGTVLFGLFFLVLFLLGRAALKRVGRTAASLLSEPSISYAGRPSHLTHPCDPPQERRLGAKWKCACGCTWIVRGRPPRLVEKKVSTRSPGPLGPLETVQRWVPREPQWFFDRDAYERLNESHGA